MAYEGPLVVAHRGSSHAVPEHTLAGYQQAVVEGADALECDVRLTRDGHLVCVHDRRIDRTSSGQGLVSTLELADLAELDFVSWRAEIGETSELPDKDGNGVLTFERLIELVLEAPRRVELHVETKHPTRYAGLVEQTLVRMLRDHGAAGEGAPVTVMSFAPLGLRRIRLLAPDVPTVLLIRTSTYGLWRDGILPQGVRIAGPSINTVRRHPKFIHRAQLRGHRVHVWTVDDPDDVDLVLELGADAIITNRPAEVLRRVGRV